MKKALVLLLLTLSILSCGCEKQQESYGDIKDVTIEDGESEETDAQNRLFQESKDDLGYAYREVDSRRAEMKFQVPRTWKVRFISQRLIQIQAPKDDPKLPGVTLYVQHGLNLLGEYNQNTPDEFEQFFSEERTQMTYQIEGAFYYQSYMPPPDRVVAHTEITREKTADLFSLHIYENAPMFRYRYGTSPAGAYTAFYAYVKWQDLPCCFSLVCEEGKEADAEKLLTHIVSTIKLSKAKVGATRTEEIEGVRFTVPKDFARVESDGLVVLKPSMKESSYFGGSAIALITLPKGFTEDLSGKGSFTEALCQKMLGKSSAYVLGVLAEPQTVSLGGRKATLYSLSCDMFGSGDLKDPMPPVLNGFLYLYCFSDEKTEKAVVLLTSSTPEDAIIALANLVEERTQILEK